MYTRNLYVIYDTLSGTTVGPIMAERHDTAAIRTFEDLLGNRDTSVGQHPDDYELRRVGTQDLDTADITAARTITIATGRQWRENQERRENATHLHSDSPRDRDSQNR